MNALSPRAFLSAMLLLLMAGAAQAFVTDCARPIMLGEVKMKDATLEEAVACIKASVAKIEGFESNHLNIVILGPAPHPHKRISLDLENIPLKDVLEHVAKTMGMRLRIEAFAVVLTPVTSTEPNYTRIYRVPPDFIATGSAAK